MFLVDILQSLAIQAVYLVALTQVWVAEEPLMVALALLALVGVYKLFEVSK
jgi:hypothetical protein